MLMEYGMDGKETGPRIVRKYTIKDYDIGEDIDI